MIRNYFVHGDVFSNLAVQFDLNTFCNYIINIFLEGLPRKTVRRYCRGKHPTQHRMPLVNCDLVSQVCKVISSGQTRRA